LQLKTNGQQIFGEGRINTIGDKVFIIKNGLSDISIRGLTLENLGEDNGGNDKANAVFSTTTQGVGLEKSEIKDLKLIGFGIAISLSGIGDDEFENEFFGPSGRNKIEGCEIINTLAEERIGSGGGHAIYVRGGYFQVISNRIENMQGGILAPTYGIVSNNIILNAWDDNGIYCVGSVSVSVTGNYIENTKADGIALNKSQRVSVVGNTIINAGNGSIRIQASKNCTITGNNIRGTVTNHFNYCHVQC